MALRSLAGKLGARLLRWGKASTDVVPPPAAAADLEMVWKPMKFEGSVEAQADAIMTSYMERERLLLQESKTRISKNYRDSAIMAAAAVGIMTFFWSRAGKAFDEALKAEGGNAVEGKAVDAEEGKPMDEEQA